MNNKFENDGVLGAIHRVVYPPDSKYSWYRQGKVKHTNLATKYLRFLVLTVLAGLAGSGAMMFAFLMAISFMMQEWYGVVHGFPSAIPGLIQNPFGEQSSQVFRNVSGVASDALQSNLSADYMNYLIQDPRFILFWMILSGTFTFVVYYICAASIYNEFYVRRRDDADAWKCQSKFMTKELEFEEKCTGLFNAFVSGFGGTGLFFYHLNRPFLKFYYEFDENHGWLDYFGGCILVFVWIDFYSYWIHRILHHKYVYKYVHKWHHRYKQPTPFGAFAIHPVEYFSFQTAGIWCAAVFPIHIMSFLTVVTFIAYHNIIDHSGVDFEGELPFIASSKFHDTHHEKFHLNYATTIVMWDWVFNTLEQKNRKYGEDIFEGEQDIVVTEKKFK